MEVPITKVKTLTVLLSLFMILLVATFGSDQEANAQEQQQGGEIFGDFNLFDANNNDEIIEQEFNQGLFESWDTNNNNVIDQNEFNIGTNAWFENADVNFNVFDVNNNGEITRQEFTQGATDAGLFGVLDADNNNVLDQNEFNQVTSQGQMAQGGTTMIQGGTTMMQGGTTTMGGTMMESTSGSTTSGGQAAGDLPESGGPAILLPGAALLLGAGLLTYGLLRRR